MGKKKEEMPQRFSTVKDTSIMVCSVFSCLYAIAYNLPLNPYLDTTSGCVTPNVTKEGEIIVDSMKYFRQ